MGKTYTVEIDREAVERLREEAIARGLQDKLISTCAAVDRVKPWPCDAVLLDPPRKGMPKLPAFLKRMNPARVVYVSCHLETLARDLRNLVDHGWTVKHIRAYELFPHTGHLELMAVVDRDPSRIRA